MKYNIYGSLTDYFYEQGIKEEVNAKPKTGSVTLHEFSKKEADALCSEAIIFIEKEHGLPEKKWSLLSLEQLQKEIVLYQKTFIRDVRNHHQRKLRADIMQAVRSFIILFPLIPLYLLYLACIDKNYTVIHFLSGILPFTFDVSGLELSEDTVFSMAGNMAILMFVSILPSWIVCRGISGWIFWLSIANVSVIVAWFHSPVAMTAITLIANIAVLYMIKSSRVRIRPFMASVVPVLLIIFISDIVFKDTPPSSKIERPLNYEAHIMKPVPVRIGPSESYAVIATTRTDTVKVIAVENNWSLIQYQFIEGYVHSESLKRLPIMEGVVHKRNPYLMSAPSYDSARVVTVTKGARVDVLAVENEWYFVRVKETIEGYLHSKDIQVKDVIIQPADPFTDSRDGKTYKTVKIGEQVWMAENLNYDAGSGSWCYDNNPSNCKKYGRLYNWEVAKRIAPSGWHLPSKDEFETLLIVLGGSGSEAYTKIIPGGAYGFNALFGGHRIPSWDYATTYEAIDRRAHFWTQTKEDDQAWFMYVSAYYKSTGTNIEFKNRAFSVRLIKD
jgi:uncharacterized protein (TIGR02145 family)